MPIEKSVGAVVFRREDNEIYYLLLYYPSVSHRAKKNYWDFPKGHIEKGENILKTVRREVFEETGLKNIKLIKGFKETIKYFFKAQNKTIFKIVIFFLAETRTKIIKISHEHLEFRWLPYEKAFKSLSFKNAKEVLKKANNFLKQNASRN
jgi:bis(5'-nucleosidyl)-tetraphosphatase